MKIKGAKAVHYDSGPNMTPLVDVVMVILIFLMLAGSFGGTTHYLLSKASIQKNGPSKTPLPPGYIPPTNVDLQVQNAEDGLGFVVYINNDARNPISDPGILASKLVSNYQAYLANKGSPDHIQVVLRPSRDVHYQYIVQVYQAVLKAEFKKVAFATTS